MAENSNSSKRVDDSSYASQYPYNQVWEWPSGHQVQVDNTPGAERLFIQHPSGTYIEISADGKMQTYAVGDVKTYGKGGATTTVDEAHDVKNSGHLRVQAAGGIHFEIAGDAGIFVGGDMAAAVMGKLNARASSAYVGTDGDLNINAGGNMNMKVAGTTTMESGGDHIIKAATIKLN